MHQRSEEVGPGGEATGASVCLPTERDGPGRVYSVKSQQEGILYTAYWLNSSRSQLIQEAAAAESDRNLREPGQSHYNSYKRHKTDDDIKGANGTQRNEVPTRTVARRRHTPDTRVSRTATTITQKTVQRFYHTSQRAGERVSLWCGRPAVRAAAASAEAAAAAAAAAAAEWQLVTSDCLWARAISRLAGGGLAA